mgnify:FL=1
MVEWLAGNRIIGTTAERPNFGLPSGSVGGWVELGRHVIGTASSEVFVASLPDKRYYMVLYEDKGEASAQARLLRYNSDANNIYSNRVSTNGASDTEQDTQPQHNGWNGNNTTPQFNVWYIANLAGKEKLLISEGVMQGTAGAGTAPARTEYAGKSTLSAVINRIGVIQNAGTHSTGTTMTVLGWDPTDTHTTNFWEELASVTASGNTETFETGTFSAKKYLWIQAWIDSSGSNHGLDPYVNSDTGNNYAYRASANGATDAYEMNEDQMGFAGGWGGTEKIFFNAFIINNSANEKLMISHTISDDDVAGAGTAPNSRESSGKWVTTGSQITKFGFKNRNTNTGQKIDAGSIIKVWGSD